MKKLIVLSLTAFALFACQKNETPVVKGEGNPVKFTAKVANTYEFKSLTKESLDGKKVRIAADASLDYATSEATIEGDNLVLDNVIRWKAEQTENTTFVGIYQNVEPSAAAAFPADLKVSYNMLDGDEYDYTYHESYLTAVAKDVVPEQTAALQFKHPFSKVVVNITNNTDVQLAGVQLRNVVLAGTLNLAEATIESPAALASVGMQEDALEPTFYAVIMPVQAKPVIAVTVGEITYKYTLASAVSFAANKTYVANITINSDTPVQGEAVGFTFDVVDWEAGSVLETGEIVPSWGVLGVGGNWNEDVPMTCTTPGENATDGVWEADVTLGEYDEFKLRWNCEWALNVGMNENWQYYGLGQFDDGILVEGSQKNIKLEAAGTYHLVFTYPAKTLVVTEVVEP